MQPIAKLVNMKPDPNPIRMATAVGLLVFIGIGAVLYFFCSWPFPLLMSLTGTLCATVGSLWLASGVYLMADDQRLLQQGNHERSKMVKRMASIVQSGAGTVPLGVLYIVLGAAIQIIHSILSAFGGFGA